MSTDPYTMDLDDLVLRFRISYTFGDPLTMLKPMGVTEPAEPWLMFDPARTADALGHHAAAARIRCEDAIGRFHAAPSWRAMWDAARWAFLSGVRSDRERVVRVSFGEGEAVASAVAVEFDGRR